MRMIHGPVGSDTQYALFLSEEDMHRASEEVEMRTELVFQESLVRVADILRKVAEERE